MLSQADNEYITRTNAGTPMGEFIRRFWVPALTSEELPSPDSDPRRVRLLGEDLIAGPRELMHDVPELEDGVEPSMAARPDLYRVRSTSFVLKRSELWIDATRAVQPVATALETI